MRFWFKLSIVIVFVLNYSDLLLCKNIQAGNPLIEYKAVVKVNSTKYSEFVDYLNKVLHSEYTIIDRFNDLKSDIAYLKQMQPIDKLPTFPNFDDYKIISLSNNHSVITNGLLDSAIQLGYIVSYYHPIKDDAAPPPINIPDFSNNQKYLSDAPVGFSYKLLFGTDGALGDDVKFCDVEYGFNKNHVDFTESDITVIKDNGYLPCSTYENHGTAVLGIMLAGDNGYGITGLAPRVKAYVSHLSKVSECTNIDYAGAIINGCKYLKSGDVMLLEIQAYVPFGSELTLGPSEYMADVFDAIKAASNAGIIVIEAGGNGGLALDSVPRFMDTAERSGAIMIAAAEPSTNHIMSYSPFGSRIDLFSHGSKVFTCGYGDYYGSNDKNLMYTQNFSGTSSASALIAAATVSFQGIARKILNKPLTSAEIRDIFRKTGTAPFPSTTPIGVMPNLRQAYEYLLNMLNINIQNKENNSLVTVVNGYNGRNPILILNSGIRANEIKVYNVQGSLINSADIKNTSVIEINKTSFTPGVYFFIITTDNKIIRGSYLIN